LEKFDYFRRADVLVIGGEQTVGFYVAEFAAHTDGLRAVERPVAPAQVLFAQVFDKPAKPLAVVAAIERLARAEFGKLSSANFAAYH
jgi:hypothetical protein